MVKIIEGLHVGSFNAVNKLFLPTKSDEYIETFKKCNVESDSVQNVNTAIVSVCHDVPYWCQVRSSRENKHFAVKDEKLSDLYNSNLSNSYLNLHFDLVLPSKDDESDVEFEDGPMFVLHSIIFADDQPEERFYKAFKFSYELFEYILSLEKGLVYVHCQLGLCRSTSLICSYLMRKWKRPFLEVKRYMKSVHPKTAISHYFEYQMILYYKNGFKIEDENVFFNYYLKTLDSYLRNRHNLNLETEKDPQFVYSCKTCRTTLFSDNNIIKHEENGKQHKASECNSIFIEPMMWMKDLELQSGKMLCSNDNCNAKLGSFSWHGRNCSCGHLQVPAFQVQMSKVDRFEYSNDDVPPKDDNLQVK
ncbi:dual-specificity phosphatase, putative [Theileria annulata]|uniref:protein-tyrosine-phosphatase n=1 Tax=Theileria annulata TaxID=5874 RepID=Q4UE73_THEAN|nr:dual-specificity phosphatase, putative [Theileria annulata]CAI74616.1 dual-specificity phosphatase, putative [Theileria annulata]|eukprot:XP_952348.1 dual-specificity phosphatase, putative [Theileria annulata]